MVDLEAFVRGLPKAELHLHIEGSLEPELMFALAKRNGIALPYPSVEAVRAAYAFSNLQDFLDIYYAGAGVLQTRQDFHDLAMVYFDRAAADGVRHAEIMFDPQTHTDRGVPFAEVIEGLLSAKAEAQARHGMTSALIMSFLRHLSQDAAFATLAMAEPWLDQITAVGLDSSEVGHPPRKFEQVFAAAAAKGLKRVAHAGEEGPPAYVHEALDLLHVDRIDHGNRALEDEDLVARLAAQGMTLTVCPLSNHKLCVVEDLADHPLDRMLALGLAATVNSDDPAYFGGYLVDNYLAVARARGLSNEQLTQLARNSFAGSFLPQEVIAGHIKDIDAYAVAAH
ncbi:MULTISPECIES: adenosine deaminase [unclassified Novosphingobium]|uniref:adenosine deaminase n=1 Tax=unclassified Novosphingobium TaxID=2644732 RepID=UPI001494C652|nr:adenosine deaminase [Novosphingobium sp. BK256]MBB3373740.1 adenosine deaminase [Novosphingobium sp. BK280]MBB3378152.1 adenosine deaminase [Novosphingobium sp. BK258]MBB3420063.1 adenosine deaminase [Novosphingobium sp. BK267]MBB3447615.1 adenosine deaminase [Novosphingobium sp. BK352]MBB3477023.1 adenosine deaminase [Novosphingobium sp. BK369]MBB3500545.1 adenosine deaminase [Novosphingobium sp. BK336]MBB3536113.1 adenosine deaminase [Novosphingobium sp. BK486]MBB3555726.1 adenosine de